jgi:hypothetical protein
VALDPDTKLIPAYRVGKRTATNAVEFMGDLSERLANRVQLSSDALSSYDDAVERAFGADVDYGQEVKFYEAEPIGPGRSSPPKVASRDRAVIVGDPDPSPYLDKPSRAPELDHEDEHATVHAADQRVLKEGREPACSRGAPLRAL